VGAYLPLKVRHPLMALSTMMSFPLDIDMESAGAPDLYADGDVNQLTAAFPAAANSAAKDTVWLL